MIKCTNPAASNYDRLATEDDGVTCIYLHKVGETCYAFKDVLPETDESFTLSFSIEKGNWVFYHDYIPDFYFMTRRRLFSLVNNAIYEHNTGPVGQFYNSTPAPFFIDMVFRAAEDMTLNSVQWIAEALDTFEVEFKTLTHISVWNAYQHSGRLPTDQVFKELQYKANRKTESFWSFNDIRDIVAERGTAFLQNLFKDFKPIPGALDENLPWYDKRIMENNYFVVRFEFDNSTNTKLILTETNIDAIKSYR